MGKQYELTLERKTDAARQVRESFARAMNHPDFEDLRLAKIYIDLVLVCDAADNPDRPTGPVLKHQGLYAAAICERTTPKARLFGSPDVVIWVDRHCWLQLTTDGERDALLDHELRHIGVRAGAVDDAGRPAVQIREHDHHVGFFVGTSLRYGDSSPEARYMRSMLQRSVQGYLTGLSPEESMDATRAAHKASDQVRGDEMAVAQTTSAVMMDALAEARATKRSIDRTLKEMVQPFESVTISMGSGPRTRLTVEDGELKRSPVPSLDDEDGMPMDPDVEPRAPF